MVKEFLKTHEFVVHVNQVKRWSVVHIRFATTCGAIQYGASEDETSFDIENILSEQGIDDLSECFNDFFRENFNSAGTILGIEIYASADTKEELEALTIMEN